ncbi:unnamed protein product, partial [Musa acuminata subsp. burmannicoides]
RQGSSGQIWNAATEFDEAAAMTGAHALHRLHAAAVRTACPTGCRFAGEKLRAAFAVLFTCMRPPRTAATIP